MAARWVCISQECSAAGTSSDPIFILHKVTLRAAIQEPCSRVRGCRGCWREWWGCQVFGRIWCLPTPCNTHLPLGTSPPHMVWQERRHTRGWCGCQLGPIRLVVGESRDRQWRRASAEESGPGHLVSLGLSTAAAQASKQPSPSSGSGTPWHPQY